MLGSPIHFIPIGIPIEGKLQDAELLLGTVSSAIQDPESIKNYGNVVDNRSGALNMAASDVPHAFENKYSELG